MSRIELRNIGKRYAPHLPRAINNASLIVEPGEFCVFVGPSGCGKSSLLRMVAGLESITEGDLYIGGVRVNDIAPAKRGVAMVFQSYALYPHMTVEQNMSFGLRVLGADKAAIERKVQEAASVLQLSSLLQRLPKELSGGQRQRVAIGRAIVKNPNVFLFDEPLSNLDAALRVQTRLEIAKLHKDMRTASMIYVTHDQIEAMTLASKIVLLNTGDAIESQGSIAQIGTPMDLYHRPASLFVAEFIGSPKMNVFTASLLDAQPDYASVSLNGKVVQVAADARHIRPGTDINLGIRPEHIELVTAMQDSTLAGPLKHIERLGDTTLLYLAIEGQALCAVKIDGSVSPNVGEMLAIFMAPDNLHIFDVNGTACPRTAQLPI